MTLQAEFNGQIFTQPGSASSVDATALTALQLGYSGIAAVVGSCASGQPKTPILITSPGGLSVLGSGPAYDAARAIFNPSTQLVEGNPVRPQLVYVVRADTATQSTGTFNDAVAANSLIFTSQDYGYQTLQTSVWIASSSQSQPLTPPANDTSKMITVYSAYTNTTETYDNLGVQPILSVQYTGNGATATLTTSATQLTTTIAGQSDGSVSLTVPYAQYPNIQQIAAYINAQAGYTATIQCNQPQTVLGANLDYVANQNIKASAVNLYAVINDIVTKINNISSLVTVQRATPGNLPPANVTAIHLTGGSTTAPTNLDYSAALTALSGTRVNFLTCSAGVDNTNNLGLIFAGFGDSMQGKNELHIHLGASPNLTLAQLVTLQSSINDPNVCLHFEGSTWVDNLGNTVQYDPWMTAAFATGMQAGMPPGSSLVNKSISILGLTYNSGIDIVNNADQIILDRLVLVRYDDASKSYKFVRALTTYSQDDNEYTNESGLRSAVNFAVYAIRTDLNTKFLGARTLYTEAGSLASSIQRELVAYASVLESANVIVKGTALVNGQIQTLPSLVVDSVSISNDIGRARYGLRAVNALSWIFNEVSILSVQQVAST